MNERKKLKVGLERIKYDVWVHIMLIWTNHFLLLARYQYCLWQTPISSAEGSFAFCQPTLSNCSKKQEANKRRKKKREREKDSWKRKKGKRQKAKHGEREGNMRKKKIVQKRRVRISKRWMKNYRNLREKEKIRKKKKKWGKS